MVSQVVAIALVIAAIRWPQLATLATLGMWAVVIFGMLSAADYFRKFWRKVDDQIKRRRRKELLALRRQKRQERQAAMARASRIA